MIELDRKEMPMKLVITDGEGKVVKHLNPKNMRRLKKLLKDYGHPIPQDVDHAIVQLIFFQKDNVYADIHICKDGKLDFHQTVQTVY